MIVRNICSRSNEMSAHHRAKSPLTISEMCNYAAMQRAPDDVQPMTAEQAAMLIPARRVVVEAAVAHVQAIDDSEAKRRAALDDPPAHAAYVVARARRTQAANLSLADNA